ncbi:MAG: VIT1/CCC1 transporter family protein, partial [Gammaproteobacteria bacterium]|nr:VIT1/CCC1 transporter family protein [Gammaproteobacteria bacterium]
SAHGRAARLLPFVIAAVNGLAPMIFSFVIMLPLLVVYLWKVPVAPLETSCVVALVLIFMLGVFLGRISGVFWLWAGIRTLLVGSVTALLIFLTTLNRFE